MNAEEFRDYCKKLFVFKEIKVKKFQSWNDRRNYFKQAQKEMIEEAKKAVEDTDSNISRPALPDGTKIISIPVVELEQNNPNAQVLVHLLRKTCRKYLSTPPPLRFFALNTLKNFQNL